jgi:hypothetical protein
VIARCTASPVKIARTSAGTAKSGWLADLLIAPERHLTLGLMRRGEAHQLQKAQPAGDPQARDRRRWGSHLDKHPSPKRDGSPNRIKVKHP